MKRILFISYFWPPSGKASLHWPLKIIKHLDSAGWDISVLTVDEDTFTQKDESLLKEIPAGLKVFRSKALEPFNLYKKITGKKKDEQLIASETISLDNENFSHRLSIWIRMNLFIPDARVGWYFPAVKDGSRLIKKNEIDVIVSVGPPHTTHLIAKKLSAKYRIPFVPVLIDPWTDIIYYRNFKRNRLTLAIDKHLEKSVLENSAANIFITETIKSDFENKYPAIKSKSNVLYWGYSEEDFKDIRITEKLEDTKTIVHSGNIFSYQNPVNFWKQIKKENESGNKLKLKFIGTVDPAIKKTIDEVGIFPYTEYKGFLNYKNMLEEICNADFLLVCATEPRHVPGKLFEYLRTGRPIIAFGDGNEEVKDILDKANAGMMFGYEESSEEFFKNYNLFKANKYFIKKFDREKIAGSFSEILGKL